MKVFVISFLLCQSAKMFRTLFISSLFILAAVHALPGRFPRSPEEYGSANSGAASDDHGAASAGSATGTENKSSAASAAVGDENRPNAPMSPDDVPKPNAVEDVEQDIQTPDKPNQSIGGPDSPASPNSPDSPSAPSSAIGSIASPIAPEVQSIEEIFATRAPIEENPTSDQESQGNIPFKSGSGISDDAELKQKKKLGLYKRGKECKSKFGGLIQKRSERFNAEESSNNTKRLRRETQAEVTGRPRILGAVRRIVKKIRDFIKDDPSEDDKKNLSASIVNPESNEGLTTMLNSKAEATGNGSSISGSAVGEGSATGSADKQKGVEVSSLSNVGASGASGAVNKGSSSVKADLNSAGVSADSTQPDGSAVGSVSSGNAASQTSVTDGQVSGSVISSEGSSVGSASGTGAATSNVVSGPEGTGVAGGASGISSSEGRGSNSLNSGLATGSVSLGEDPKSGTGASGSAVGGSTSTSLAAAGNDPGTQYIGSSITAVSNRMLGKVKPTVKKGAKI